MGKISERELIAMSMFIIIISLIIALIGPAIMMIALVTPVFDCIVTKIKKIFNID